MNKSDLIASMAEAAGISKSQAGKALNSALQKISKAIKKGDKVTLVGFGTFSVDKKPARIVHNSRTGKATKTKATKFATFKAASSLSKTISGGSTGPK